MAGSQGSSDTESNEVGIVQGHAYTVLDLKLLSNGQRLIKVFNPWSRDKFTGKWSDSSSLWTNALKKEAGWVKADDGMFFMDFDDYYKMFAESYVSMDSSDWFSGSFLKLNDTSAATNPGQEDWCGRKCTRHVLTVTTEVEQDVIISAHTWEDRCMAEKCLARSSQKVNSIFIVEPNAMNVGAF